MTTYFGFTESGILLPVTTGTLADSRDFISHPRVHPRPRDIVAAMSAESNSACRIRTALTRTSAPIRAGTSHRWTAGTAFALLEIFRLPSVSLHSGALLKQPDPGI